MPGTRASSPKEVLGTLVKVEMLPGILEGLAEFLEEQQVQWSNRLQVAEFLPGFDCSSSVPGLAVVVFHLLLWSVESEDQVWGSDQITTFRGCLGE